MSDTGKIVGLINAITGKSIGSLKSAIMTKLDAPETTKTGGKFPLEIRSYNGSTRGFDPRGERSTRSRIAKM